MASSQNELIERDQQAVLYALGELNAGDTLVHISYPNNQMIVDASGFQVKNVHRVHSQNLLSTASPAVRNLLDDERQLAARRRKGYGPGKKALPPGVFYILDLTPPDADDDALQLTAELSCSRGILHWFTAVKRLAVSRMMAGGKDEMIVARHTPVNSPCASPLKGGSLSTIVTVGFAPGCTIGEASTDPLAPAPEINTLQDGEFARALHGSDNEAAFKEALKQSKEEAERKRAEDLAAEDGENAENRLLDYDPIRHRVGIERLLKVIEGKDPRLDSAPKVWTLAVLAKYFGYEQNVSGHIFTWFIAEPNCQIIEILPEATLRVGMMIENYGLTRAAFAILVSESAMICGSQIFMEPTYYKPGYKETDKKLTRLGRVRESLDDDTANLIQYASRAFAARIEQVVKDLLDPNMAWLQYLSEFDKLRRFSQWLKTNNGITENHHWIIGINNLATDIKNFVRGRLFSCLIQPLDFIQSKNGNDHRDHENWDKRVLKNFEITYDGLTDYERIMTRFFWEHLKNLSWDPSVIHTNVIRDILFKGHPFRDRNWVIADKHDIPQVTMSELENGRTAFNTAVIKALQKHNYLSGVLPSEAYKPANFTLAHPDWANESIVAKLDKLNISDSQDPNVKAKLGVIAEAQKKSTDIYPTGPIDENIPKDSPFFSLTHLLKQVKSHIGSICTEMLKRGECAPMSDLCDNITCLTQSEFKFLPLWAGGFDDGTGGVFEEAVPAAGRGAFAGPGPSYHTGSTANSAASDDFDRLSDVGASTLGARTVGSSIAVDDGHSSHLDRRVVYSEDGFGDDFEDVKREDAAGEDLDIYEASDGTTTPRAGSDDDLDLGEVVDDLDLYD